MKLHILTLILAGFVSTAALSARADDAIVGSPAGSSAVGKVQLLSTQVAPEKAVTPVRWYRGYYGPTWGGAYYRPYRPYYAARPYVYAAPPAAYYGPGYYGYGAAPYYYGPRYYRGGYLW